MLQKSISWPHVLQLTVVTEILF